MITLFNYWHFISFGFIWVVAILSMVLAYITLDKKMLPSVMFLIPLFALLLSVLSVPMVDSATKKVSLYKIANKRNLFAEEIVFYGAIKNDGDFEIGEVELEIKMTNKGKGVSTQKFGSIFVPDGFTAKPQQVVESAVIATNLLPGESREFRVYLRYPSYFTDSMNFTALSAH
jgi:hypothetical protein